MELAKETICHTSNCSRRQAAACARLPAPVRLTAGPAASPPPTRDLEGNTIPPVNRVSDDVFFKYLPGRPENADLLMGFINAVLENSIYPIPELGYVQSAAAAQFAWATGNLSSLCLMRIFGWRNLMP